MSVWGWPGSDTDASVQTGNFSVALASASTTPCSPTTTTIPPTTTHTLPHYHTTSYYYQPTLPTQQLPTRSPSIRSLQARESFAAAAPLIHSFRFVSFVRRSFVIFAHFVIVQSSFVLLFFLKKKKPFFFFLFLYALLYYIHCTTPPHDVICTYLRIWDLRHDTERQDT